MLPPELFRVQCRFQLVIDQLIGVIPVIRENLYAVSVKMLPDGGGTGGAAALPILALAEDVQSRLRGVIDKRGQGGSLGKIGIKGQAVIPQDLQVDIVQGRAEYPLRLPAVIQRPGGLPRPPGRRIIEADHGGVGREAVPQQPLGGRAGQNAPRQPPFTRLCHGAHSFPRKNIPRHGAKTGHRFRFCRWEPLHMLNKKPQEGWTCVTGRRGFC